MKMTEAEMIAIIKGNRIGECSPEEKEQVMAFAFGGEFMASEDKGTLKEYAPRPVRHAVANVPTTPAAKAAAARLKGSQRDLRMRRRARGPRLGSWGDTPARAALSFTVYLNPTHPHGYIEPSAIMRRWVCVGLDQERGKLRIRAA